MSAFGCGCDACVAVLAQTPEGDAGVAATELSCILGATMSIVAVAKRAGVSVATVSRVLNNLDNVRAETVKQVRAAMRELGYKPPQVRRGPKRGSRRLIASAFTKRQIAV